MSFGKPTLFWLLLFVPLLVVFLVWGLRAQRRALERFVASPLVGKLAPWVSWSTRRWKIALLVATMFLSVMALAQPRWGFEWREVKRRGVDIFVLLDVSKSMLAEDVRPNRLTQAKFAVKDLLNNLAGDRVGLIAFAGTAFVQCPLTLDLDAFGMTLDEVEPGLIPRGGSSIATAVETALKAFDASEGHDRAILLITDGEENEGAAVAAATKAAAAGVKVFVVGVGTTEGDLIPERVSGGPMEFHKDRQGNVVKTRLNDAVLREIALKTQGMYVRSAAGDFGIDTIYHEGIAQLKRGEFETRLQKQYHERFQWPLGLATLLLMSEYLLSDRRRERGAVS